MQGKAPAGGIGRQGARVSSHIPKHMRVHDLHVALLALDAVLEPARAGERDREQRERRSVDDPEHRAGCRATGQRERANQPELSETVARVGVPRQAV